MSDILSKLKSAHEARSRVKVHVAEYGFDLYFPTMTLERHNRCRRGINPKDEAALFVNTLIVMAENEDGTPAFPDSGEMRAELHKMSLVTLMWIIQASGGERISEAALAQISDLDADAMRAAMTGAAGGAEAPELAAAIDGASDARIAKLCRELAAEHEAGQPAKNF